MNSLNQWRALTFWYHQSQDITYLTLPSLSRLSSRKLPWPPTSIPHAMHFFVVLVKKIGKFCMEILSIQRPIAYWKLRVSSFWMTEVARPAWNAKRALFTTQLYSRCKEWCTLKTVYYSYLNLASLILIFQIVPEPVDLWLWSSNHYQDFPSNSTHAKCQSCTSKTVGVVWCLSVNWPSILYMYR